LPAEDTDKKAAAVVDEQTEDGNFIPSEATLIGARELALEIFLSANKVAEDWAKLHPEADLMLSGALCYGLLFMASCDQRKLGYIKALQAAAAFVGQRSMPNNTTIH